MSEPHLSEYPTPSASRLTRVLEASARDTAGENGEIREAVCDFVRELKARGLAPERVLVSVKNVIAAADGGEEGEEQRRFLQQLITWCIEEYYRAG